MLEGKPKASRFPADHRKIGKQLDLFSINPEIGAGLVLWHPKGALIRRIIRNVWEREHLRNGYRLVCTPHIARGELWKTSGHLEYYAENMYIFEKDGEPYVIKPMNCPFHIQIYKAKPRSYKELPIRYAEWGTVYRYERSG
ncbi:MAG: threonine--tRNA ligase, partial [Methanobacteriota archaeon]